MQLLITKIAKVAQKYSSLFSPIAAQTAQTEEFIFQNVAYRATVYRTGVPACHFQFLDCNVCFSRALALDPLLALV